MLKQHGEKPTWSMSVTSYLAVSVLCKFGVPVKHKDTLMCSKKKASVFMFCEPLLRLCSLEAYAGSGDKCILALRFPSMEPLEVAQCCRCWSVCLICLLRFSLQPCARSRQTGGMCTDHWTKPAEDFLKINIDGSCRRQVPGLLEFLRPWSMCQAPIFFIVCSMLSTRR